MAEEVVVGQDRQECPEAVFRVKDLSELLEIAKGHRINHLPHPGCEIVDGEREPKGLSA